MNIQIDNRIFDKFPEVQIGVVKINFNPASSIDTKLLLRNYESLTRKMYTAPLLEVGELSLWRNTYKILNVKKGVRVSAESLLKRVIKGKELPSINPLVDIYNCISLKYALPVGGEDLNTVSGNIYLTLAEGNESFTTIGSDTNDPPEIDEVIYKDDIGCLCRRWNWREADRTKLTDNTTDAIIVLETLSKEYSTSLQNAIEHFNELAIKYLNATTKSEILSINHPTMKLD